MSALVERRGSVHWVRPAHHRLSLGAALIAAVGSVVGLSAVDQIYGNETVDLVVVSVAQDLVNLIVVAPLIVVLGVLGSRGSLRAYLCWLGTLAFTVYSYVIYAFSIQFGPLFLAWLAVLGLSFYALVLSLAGADTEEIRRRFGGRPMPRVGWTIVALAALFGLLWLREIVPDLLAGRPSTSADVWQVPTNPVHVLDLSVVLPAVLIAAVSLMRRAPLGYVAAPGVFVFLALTCLPILVTPLVAVARGVEPAWAVMAPILVVLLVTTGSLWWMLRAVAVKPAPAS